MATNVVPVENLPADAAVLTRDVAIMELSQRANNAASELVVMTNTINMVVDGLVEVRKLGDALYFTLTEAGKVVLEQQKRATAKDLEN